MTTSTIPPRRYFAQYRMDAELVTSSVLPPLYATAVRKKTIASRFLPEHIYEYYAKQSLISLRILPAGHMRYRDLPDELVNVMPLDKSLIGKESSSTSAQTTGTFGFVTSLYKAISTDDGFTYAVRRVDGARCPPAVQQSVVQEWSRAAHPNVITLRRVFTVTPRMGLGSSVLYFLHDYYPGAKSLRELFLEELSHPLTESMMWSYLCQIISGLRAVHAADLTFRGLSSTHVLVTGHNRVRISSAGVLDVLEADSPKTLQEYKQLDVKCVGEIMLQLACHNVNAHTSTMLVDSIRYVQKTYSKRFFNIILVLISKAPSVEEVSYALAPVILNELDHMYAQADTLDHLLSREADNGRLLRLLIKLGFINERPEYEYSPLYQENGERYSLKLFRDFLFHQINEDQNPVIDLGHVIDALNRLDAGTDDKILLSARDGSTIQVATYESIRSALSNAFVELRSHAYSKANNGAGAVGPTSGAGSAIHGSEDNHQSEWIKKRIPAVIRARSKSHRPSNANSVPFNIAETAHGASLSNNNGGGSVFHDLTSPVNLGGMNALNTLGNMGLSNMSGMGGMGAGGMGLGLNSMSMSGDVNMNNMSQLANSMSNMANMGNLGGMNSDSMNSNHLNLLGALSSLSGNGLALANLNAHNIMNNLNANALSNLIPGLQGGPGPNSAQGGFGSFFPGNNPSANTGNANMMNLQFNPNNPSASGNSQNTSSSSGNPQNTGSSAGAGPNLMQLQMGLNNLPMGSGNRFANFMANSSNLSGTGPSGKGEENPDFPMFVPSFNMGNMSMQSNAGHEQSENSGNSASDDSNRLKSRFSNFHSRPVEYVPQSSLGGAGAASNKFSAFVNGNVPDFVVGGNAPENEGNNSSSNPSTGNSRTSRYAGISRVQEFRPS